jgi:hypothetical protein
LIRSSCPTDPEKHGETLSIGLRQDVSHDDCSGTVTLFDRVAVNAQRKRRIGVTEPPSDRSNVYSCADQLRGREVPEIVKSDCRCFDGITNPNEERCHVVGSERYRAITEWREHEAFSIHVRSNRAGKPTGRFPEAAQQGDSDAVKRNGTRPIRLRGLLGNSASDYDDGARHLDSSDR